MTASRRKLLDPAASAVAGVVTDLLPPWLARDEMARETRRVGARIVPTLTSSDAPAEVVLSSSIVASRVGLHGREALDAPRAQSSSAVSRGSLVGANADASAPPSSVYASIVHADVVNPARRSRDPSTVEAAHARAVDEHGDSAFRRHSGFGTAYMDAGVPARAVTPMWASHLRLSALEDTLVRMRLAPGGDGSSASVSAGGSFDGGSGVSGATPPPRWVRSGSGTFHFTPLPSPMVAPGTPRFSGAAQGRRSGSRSSSVAALAAPRASPTTTLSRDASALAVLRWKPQAVAPPTLVTAAPDPAGSPVRSDSALRRTAGAAAAAHAMAHALVSSLPPPAPFLRPSASAHAFVSRGSSEGLTPRLRTSKLDAALGRLLAARGGGGVPGSAAPASVGAQSSWGGGSVQLALPAAAAAALTPGDAAAALASLGSPLAGLARGSVSARSSASSPRSASGSASPRVRAAGGASPGKAPGGSLWDRSSAAPILVGPASDRDASGVLRGVTRADAIERVSGLRSPGLVRMRSGRELLAMATVQARAIRRLDANHDTDLTAGWVLEGKWPALNLSGNTLSPTRRAALPRPLAHEEAESARVGGALHANAAVARGQAAARDGGEYDSSLDRRLSYFEGIEGWGSATGSAVDSAAGGGDGGAPAGGARAAASSAPPQTGDAVHDVTRSRTVFGELLAQRGASPERSTPAELEYLSATRALSAAGATVQSGAPAGETRALDAWGAARGIDSPRSWPTKVLRSKLRVCGLLQELGLAAPGAVDAASHDVLLRAYLDIPAAQRKRALWGRGGAPSGHRTEAAP